MRAIAVLIALLCPVAALAQIAGTANLGGPQAMVSTPIPDSDFAAIAGKLGLVESSRPARELIKGWRKPRKILVAVDNNTNRLAWLQAAAPGVRLVAVHNKAEALAQIADADALIRLPCERDYLESGKILHWIQQGSVSVAGCFQVGEHTDAIREVPQPLMDGSVVITNLSGVLARPLAEHAIAMMMTLGRGLDLYVKQQEQHHFQRDAIPQGRLWVFEGRTMLVVGLGAIGTNVADIAHGLGMTVIATRNSGHQGPTTVSYVGLSGELPSLVVKADVVVLAAPLTPETRHLFDAAMFRRMKKGALLINVASGGEVVSADLVDALKSGQLGGAGLDLADPANPSNLGPGDPLFGAPNLIMSPETASHAVDTRDASGGEDMWALARENLRRYVAGDRLYAVVDPKRGY
ncbi:MAG TPA: D-2-hydroxyacid dehydrogenase [Rhizomicrobium sp.]|nr:D-2-hydroxyacid dehydrogenase [Rhizomicrobium sp.]